MNSVSRPPAQDTTQDIVPPRSSPDMSDRFLSPESLDNLYEYSKFDQAGFVGSDIRQLIGEIRRLRAEIATLLEQRSCAGWPSK